MGSLNLEITSVIKTIRVKKNIKQEWVAHQIGWSKANYSKFESGKFTSIDVSKLEKIGEAIEVPILQVLLYVLIQQQQSTLKELIELHSWISDLERKQ
ncbi:MAG: helix-turn-helix transcriptional regulator [Bacteroidia bacterium]|jgi:transcriptional regulator with XRE-family HTH domain|nr:helix-turn-helix transcriptional regulator [Bacteroidia bacterium]